MTNIKPITLKCVKEFNNTSKWRGKLSPQQLLNSPLGKYLDINRTDAVAEVGINYHGDNAYTFGIKIRPKRGDRYETKIYGHIQDNPHNPEKDHVIMKGVDNNNKINLHLTGNKRQNDGTNILFNDNILFDDVSRVWAKINQFKDQLSFFVLDSFNQKSSEILNLKLKNKKLHEANKASTLEKINKLDEVINTFESATSTVKNIDKTIEDDLKAGKTIYNMSFRQLEKRKAQEIADNLKNDYEISIAKKNKLLEDMDNYETIDTKKIDKRYNKNCIKQEKFCDTHNIEVDKLHDEYGDELKVSGTKNLMKILNKM